MRIVRANNIETWANTLDARSMLPGIVRRLAHTTGKGLRRVDLPAGEGVQRPGWDGVVIAETATAFVPEGTSLWEAGVSGDPREKADGDFDKRTKDPLGFVPAESTFIFVTPRKWTNKAHWIEEKKSQGIWKDVLVYDSDSLEQWLETAPSVSVWFAQYLGIRPPGVEDPESHWAALALLTNPAFSPDVFLTSREKEATELLDWLEGAPGELVIETRSPGEAIDFVCACLAHVEETRRSPLVARTVLVETGDAWRDLVLSGNPLVLIAKPGLVTEPEMVAAAIGRGHHVMSSVSNPARRRGQTMHLPRVYQHDLCEALKKAGFSEVDAEKAARAAGGSCAILKRRLTTFTGQARLKWAGPDHAPAVTPFLWVGEWTENCGADRAVVEKIGGKPYDQMVAIAVTLSRFEDPPLVRAIGEWRLSSPDDAWMLLGEFVTEEQLKCFMSIAKEVLAEIDPRYDLAPEERFYANIHGHVPKFSKVLRESVAETLALLGALEQTIGLPTNWEVRSRVDAVVREIIPENATWKHWASLSSILPLLAEASPNAFLSAAERDLRSSEPQLIEILRDEGEGTFSGRCNHAGLLWALESLAWSPEYLTRVCNILVELDERDPGGKWANRPGATASAILSTWYPQTTATVDQRIQVLEYVATRHPQGIMRLLLALLPDSMALTRPTIRPRWRDWATTWSPGASTADYWKQVESCTRRAIDMCGPDADRWCALLKHVADVPMSVHADLLAALNRLTEAPLSQEERRRVSELLHEEVEMHRSHADAEWALPAEVRAELDAVQRAIAPDDPVYRHASIFAQWPERSSVKSIESPDEWRDELEKRRREAIDEILKAGGFEAILRLCQVAESADTVGMVLAASLGDAYIERILPALLSREEKYLYEFAAGFIIMRAHVSGWDWVDNLPIGTWQAPDAARFFSVLRFDRAAWDRVSRISDAADARYWEIVPAFNPHLDLTDTVHAAERLLEMSRPGRVVSLLRMAIHGKVPVPSDLLLRTLEHGLMLNDEEKKQFLHEVRHEVGPLIAELQSRIDLDVGRLAGLEFHYLGFLDGHPETPRTLHRMLSRDPKLFAELLLAIFPPKDESDERREYTAQERSLAMQGYRLLASWETVPGLRDDGTVDSAALHAWVEEVRTITDRVGRREIADERIGHVLSKAPAGTDGTWPCESVRNVLESFGSEDMAQGFRTEIYNSRGVYMRGVRDGGQQERDLAEKYETFAAAYQIESPRTAASLQGLAVRYRREAKEADEEAEWRE